MCNMLQNARMFNDDLHVLLWRCILIVSKHNLGQGQALTVIGLPGKMTVATMRRYHYPESANAMITT